MVLNKNVVCSCGNSSQHTSSNPGYGGKGPFAVGQGLGPPWAERGKSSRCSQHLCKLSTHRGQPEAVWVNRGCLTARA